MIVVNKMLNQKMKSNLENVCFLYYGTASFDIFGNVASDEKSLCLNGFRDFFEKVTREKGE